jgi:hypothetical protein
MGSKTLSDNKNMVFIVIYVTGNVATGYLQCSMIIGSFDSKWPTNRFVRASL